MCTILLYKLADPKQNVIRLYVFSLIRCLPVYFYCAHSFGEGLDKDHAIVLLLEFSIVFCIINLIPVNVLTKYFSNIYMRSFLIFEFGNQFAAQVIAVCNDIHTVNEGKMSMMLLHFLFISSTFVGPDLLEFQLVNSGYDSLGIKINYSIYAFCLLMLLVTDYILQTQGDQLEAGEWRYIKAPSYTDDSANYYKVLTIHYAFGVYMCTVINRYEPVYV